MARRVHFGVNMEENGNLEVVQEVIAVVEKAFIYLTKNRYSADCSKNDKHSIKRKAERLVAQNGQLFYKKRGGS